MGGHIDRHVQCITVYKRPFLPFVALFSPTSDFPANAYPNGKAGLELRLVLWRIPAEAADFSL